MGIELHTDKKVIVRKQHQCCWCGEIIEKGDAAYYRKYKSDGDFRSDHMHPECYVALGDLDNFYAEEGWCPGDYPRGGIEFDSKFNN